MSPSNSPKESNESVESSPKTFEMFWRVNTLGLMEEVLNNPGASQLQRPLQIFNRILLEVAERAAELNDPKMNALMARLALYEVTDPYHANFDKELTDKIIRDGGYGAETAITDPIKDSIAESIDDSESNLAPR